MALTRRALLAGLSSSAALAACSGVRRRTVSPHQYQELYQHEEKGRDTVLVCMPETSQTEQAWVGLSDEFAGEFGVVALRVEGKGDAELIAEAVARHQPRGVILMNNPTLAAYRSFERSRAGAQRLPNVSIMTSFLQAQALGPNATGVAYEIPLITSVTQLRKVMASRTDRVGVVYRSRLRRFVALQTELAKREQISVTGEVVGEQPNESEIKRALRRLKQRVDAIWVLNDNQLLTPHLISKGWLPGLNEKPWKPTVVGAESLVRAELSFGTFAVLPDHTELGTQAASVMFDIADEGWALPRGYKTQLPLSTKVTIDLVQAKERFELQPDALAQVDRVLEG